MPKHLEKEPEYTEHFSECILRSDIPKACKFSTSKIQRFPNEFGVAGKAKRDYMQFFFFACAPSEHVYQVTLHLLSAATHTHTPVSIMEQKGLSWSNKVSWAKVKVPQKATWKNSYRHPTQYAGYLIDFIRGIPVHRVSLRHPYFPSILQTQTLFQHLGLQKKLATLAAQHANAMLNRLNWKMKRKAI